MSDFYIKLDSRSRKMYLQHDGVLRCDSTCTSCIQ